MHGKTDFDLDMDEEPDGWEDVTKLGVLTDGTYGIGRASEVGGLGRRRVRTEFITTRWRWRLGRKRSTTGNRSAESRTTSEASGQMLVGRNEQGYTGVQEVEMDELRDEAVNRDLEEDNGDVGTSTGTGYSRQQRLGDSEVSDLSDDSLQVGPEERFSSRQ